MNENTDNKKEFAKQPTSPSLRTKNIIEHVTGQWRRFSIPSSEKITAMLDFIEHLSAAEQKTALTIIAEYMLDSMKLHMLSLLASFQHKAEIEGFSVDEISDTLKDTQGDILQQLASLHSKLSVPSLDKLAALSNITVTLLTLSNAKTAEEIQTWLYDLPEAYIHKLT